MSFQRNDYPAHPLSPALTSNRYKPVSLHLWMTDGYEYFLNTNMWDFIGFYSINENELVHTATKISGRYWCSNLRYLSQKWVKINNHF
jgi:hypothetical protein